MATTFLKLHKGLYLFISLVFFLCSYPLLAQQITKPSLHFGFEPGADGMLFSYEKMVDYFKTIENQSGRIKTVQIGSTALGRPLYMVCISSEENIANLEELKSINKELAINPSLSASKVDELKRKGKVFFLGTLSMHSTEVAPAQAAPTIAYKLVTAMGADTLSWLDNVVYMMVPCHNPDGMNMVVDNYLKYKGTKYEGSNLPGVYHKYAGHNINRDFVTLTQPENKAISALTSIEWFPQVMVEKHQMGSTGARYFVPPNHDPIAQNIDETLWSWIGLFGANMLNDMTALGQKGISQRYIFDNYWPGSTETCLWKNVISFLTEAASVKTASPIFIEKNELKVWGKGLSEYKKGSNLIAPWEGGWWRLSDLVAYELSSTFSIIKTAAANREKILQHRNDMCKKEFKKGSTQPPFYFIFPSNQNDQSELGRLVDLLVEHGVAVAQLSQSVTVDSRVFQKGDIVVPLSQPFRAFVKEVLERQKYPERRYMPGGEIIKPYDITSWSLPLSMGLEVMEVNTKSIDLEQNIKSIEKINFDDTKQSSGKYLVFSASNNESYQAAFALRAKGVRILRTSEDLTAEGSIIAKGSFVVNSESKNAINELGLYVQPIQTDQIQPQQVREVNLPSIIIVETWFHDMDAGWTRYIFDTYNIPYKVIRPNELADVNILKNAQTLIFPSQNAELLISGKRKRDSDYMPMNMPPEYAKGMGTKGKQNVLKFLSDGGRIIAWGQSVELFLGMQEIEIDKENKEEFTLPIQNAAKELAKNGFEIFEAHVKVAALDSHPLTLGMRASFPIIYNGNIALETSIPTFDTDRRVILSFPEGEPGLSGYVKKGELLENKAALVWVKKNKGQLVLFSFNPQFRASTPGTYKLLFNALLMD